MLAGVPKCGTTSLFGALQEHPAVAAPVRKEPQFFALDGETVAEHLGWYRSLFPAEAPALLDGSTLTCLSSHAPGLIETHAPGARVVMVIRDPAKRTFSAHNHAVRQVPFAERRSFDDVLAAMEACPAGQDLPRWEDAQIREAGRAGQLRLDYYRPDFHQGRFRAPFPTTFVDPLAVYRYFGASSYRHVIAPWRETFGSRLHVVVFERLVRQPSETLAEVQSFLGLAPEPLALSHENEGRLPRNRAIRLLLGFTRRTLVGQRLGDALRAAGVVGLSNRFGGALWASKPSLPERAYDRTRALLEDEYRYWFERDPSLEELWRY